jgi:pimeloyl-ACP methyl ester carboxylesterase
MSERDSFEVTRVPYMIGFVEQAGFKDTYGGDAGFVFIEAMQIRPVGRESKSCVVLSHTIGGGSFLPVMTALARAGHHVIYINTRYRGNDTALIMEKCVLDLAACIRDLRERFGYAKFVLGGWSGGGSLALFYQDQAEKATITTTPAGDLCDLTDVEIPSAHGIFLIAAHVGRSVTLTEWIDASVLDEADPNRRELEFDLYNPACPHQAPYSSDFVARYREAQIARNRRITSWVFEKLEELKKQGRPNDEHGFIVHRTMADTRWLDPAVDPNERKPGTCYLGDPQVVNNSPVGLARFCSLRSWLSQWSYDESKAHGERNDANTHLPTLVIGNGADDACTPSHLQRLHDALPHDDKELHTIAGATHYYMGQREQLKVCISHYDDWAGCNGFVD